MNKIMIILNAVYYNRGSEALARSIASICRKKHPGCDITLVSSEADFENSKKLEGIDHNIRRYNYVSKYSPVNIRALCWKILGRNVERATYIRCKNVIEQAKNMDCVVVVGGDNYDQSYGLYYIIHSLNLTLRRYVKGRLVLYDCSLEEKDITKEVVEDISLFDAVSARETLTYKNFGKFIDKKLFYYPDPAFIMRAEAVNLPDGWKANGMIGVNVSNLVASGKYGITKEQILESYVHMIEHLIDHTEFNISLIPHVMDNADLSVLSVLYKKFKASNRVILIDDEQLTAPQLKYLISQCRFLITARTHASIAAYSSCVPTLVLGYSIKSIGIATDLFGTSDHYVIPVDKLYDPEILINGVAWLLENEFRIKLHLEAIIPKYLEKTWDSVELFEGK